VHVGLSTGHFTVPDSLGIRQVTAAAGDPGGLAAAAALLLSLFFSMNLLLFVLNMLPVPPLDGSGALALVLPTGWVDAYQAIFRQPIIAIVAFLFIFNFAGEVFRPCFFFAVGLLYPGVAYE
jgi:Zn-dependent protease